jgi:transcriptional regulator with XRE-family HTH domain
MAITTNEDVARRVRGYAAETRTTQRAVSHALGLSAMSISRRFHGDTPFTAEELITVANLMNVPVAAFFEPSERAA